jgi:CBS domain-containing protein
VSAVGESPACGNGTSVVLDEIAGYLARAPAFRVLGSDELKRLAGIAEVDFVPAGTVMLTEGGPPSDYLQIVVSGGVKVSLPTGDRGEVEVDYRSEGAAIGYLSLFSGDRSRVNVVAAEDTVCLLIPREPFLDLLERRPDIREFFTRTFISTYMDKAFSDMRAASLTEGGREQLLFTTPVGELTSREPVSAPSGVSIREAAGIMARNRVSSLILTDAAGAPVGILTDSDLRDKVAAAGLDGAGPVAAVMSPVAVTVDASALCFDALLAMMRNNVHHLPVLEDGRLRRVITNHDLMLLAGNSPLSVVRDIDDQQDLAGLARAAGKVDALISTLLKEGARAGNIGRVITEINDRLVSRTLELVGRELGPAPVAWSWIVFGSEGRREQSFKTDQDNAIVYADPRDPEQARRALDWFARFTPRVRDALAACGFPPCPAGYVAANPAWCQPLESWKHTFSGWIAAPDAEAVLRALILFDFRPLAAGEPMATELRAHLNAAIRRTPAFLGFLANQIVKNPPPIGFLNRLVVEKEGEHRDRLNLKLRAIAPIVDLARLFALEKGVVETGTLDRLRALRGLNTIVGHYGEELEQAFEFLMFLRINHQHAQIAAGLEPDNFVDPRSLSALEMKTAREAFGLVAKLQGLVIERYRASIL